MNNTLNTFERKVVLAAKGWHGEKSRLDAVIKLFRDEYWWGEEVYYHVIYNDLVEIMFKICSMDNIKWFFARVFDRSFQSIATENFSEKRDSNVVDIKTMVLMMLSHISELKTYEEGKTIINLDLPKDDPMYDFVERKTEETRMANESFFNGIKYSDTLF